MNKSKKYTKTTTNSSISEPMIFEPINIPKPHRFTLNTQSAFKKLINKLAIVQKSKLLANNDLSIIKSIYRGRLVCSSANCFHVTVSEGLVNRAIFFLDTLAKELENRKFKIVCQQEGNVHYVIATKANEHISFHISEGFKYHPIDNDKRSELERMLYRDRKPVPTGKITLSLSALDTNISKSWSDGSRTIEDALPTIINGFEHLVLRQKQRKIDNAMREKQRLEDAMIFGETESRKYAEKAIYENAMKEANSFIAHQNLDAYLNYLEVNYLNEFGCLDASTQSWLSTARKFSETLSPVSKRLELFKNMRISIQ